MRTNWHAVFRAQMTKLRLLPSKIGREVYTNLTGACHFLATVPACNAHAGRGSPNGGLSNETGSQRTHPVFVRGCAVHGDRADGGELRRLITPLKPDDLLLRQVRGVLAS